MTSGTSRPHRGASSHIKTEKFVVVQDNNQHGRCGQNPPKNPSRFIESNHLKRPFKPPSPHAHTHTACGLAKLTLILRVTRQQRPDRSIDRHGRPLHERGLRAGPRAPAEAHRRGGLRDPGDRPLATSRRRRRGRGGRRGGRGEPGLGLLRGGGPRRSRGHRGARGGGAARVLRAAGGPQGRRAAERGGAAGVLRVGAHQERQGLEGGVRPRPAQAAGRLGRRPARVRQQVAPGRAGIQGVARGVRCSDGRSGVQAAGADLPEPEPATGPSARLLQGPDHVHPAEPLPTLPEPGPRPRRRPPQGRRRPDHPLPGRHRRARRPAALRRRVGPRQARAQLVHHQRRRPHSGVEQRQVRERGAPCVGELGQGEVLHAVLLQPGELHHGGTIRGAGERGQPGQVQRLQLGRVLQHQEEQQLQEAQRGERPDRTFQEEYPRRLVLALGQLL